MGTAYNIASPLPDLEREGFIICHIEKSIFASTGAAKFLELKERLKFYDF